MKQHQDYIKRCQRLAKQAAERGDHLDGALLVYEQQVILTAENTQITDKLPLNTAVANLLACAFELFEVNTVQKATLYVFEELGWLDYGPVITAGIQDVVYGLPRPQEECWQNPTLKKVFEKYSLNVLGPIDQEGCQQLRKNFPLPPLTV